MKEFFLKNGEKAQINISNYDKIKAFTERGLPSYPLNNMGDRAFVGFAYFGPSLPRDLKRVDPDHNYSKETSLSSLEIQTQKSLKKEYYHRALAVQIHDNIVGIVVCEWVKFFDRFWNYHIRYIDVRKDYKNQGVGTNLIKALDQARFIKGKILFHGLLSPEGGQYIAHIVKREMKAKDYAMVFEDYYGKNPTHFGIYGGESWGK